MKRRKFVTAGVFFAMLLAAALAAASVGSAATARTFAKGHQMAKIGWGGSKNGGQYGLQPKGTSFVSAGVSKVTSVSKSAIEAQGHLIALANRPIKGGAVGAGHAPSSGAGSTGLPTVIPHIHSTAIVGGKKYDAGAQGLNEFWQEATHGGVCPLCFGGLTPPDQALGEGNGYAVEAVNDMIIVTDTSFTHWNGVMRLEDLMAPAIFLTGQTAIGDPRVYYDTDTNRWFITTYATDGASSSVYIAVSTTGNPAGAYAVYVLDVTNDGTDCTGGCFGDQPLLGADRYAIWISTNSFSNGTGALNGTQLYEIDKTALVGQAILPSIWYEDMGADYSGIIYPTNTCGMPNPNPSNGFCLASLQPATSPNAAYQGHYGGTEYGLQSLDPLASLDNSIVEWAFTGTAGVSFQGAFVQWAVVGTEAYGYPFTSECMVMPQMSLFGVSTDQCGYAQQPPSGNMPFCDFEYFGPGCEPGGIQADDDRMQQVQAITGHGGTTVLTSGLSTDALVADPIGVLHRRDAVAWFQLNGTTASVLSQGYIGNWQNDILYPSVVGTVSTGGTQLVASLDVTGNNVYPSLAIAKWGVHSSPSQVGIGVAGQDTLDDFCTDVPICGGPDIYRPRYGDYSAAVADGSNVYVAGEYSGSSCTDAAFIAGPYPWQCNPFTAPITPIGFTTPRGFASNWATGLLRTHT